MGLFRVEPADGGDGDLGCGEMVVVEAVSSFDVRVILCAVEGREGDSSRSSSESVSQVISSSSLFCVEAPGVRWISFQPGNEIV